MISRRTRIQLAVFVVITLLGVSFVGARYAKLDRLVADTRYTVMADFADSGGIFVGAQVTYRGVGVGQVTGMELDGDGVEVALGIDEENAEIPSDLRAVVANKSAVGEQYVDLQPQVDGQPYLADGSRIARDRTQLPLPTTTLLIDINELVNSVDQDNLRTTISELGVAFDGAGEDLSTIIDTGNSFIETADANFDVTAALIRDSRTVLQTQLDSAGSIRTFARRLRQLSDTFVDSDQDIRTLIDEGSASATTLRAFVDDNSAAIGQLLDNVASTNRILMTRLDGIEQILVLYPYVAEGGYTVVDRDKGTGLYASHFGLVLTSNPPVCTGGYESVDQRSPHDRTEIPFDTTLACTEPQSQSSPRGAQNAPAYNRPAPVVGVYDSRTGRVRGAGPDELGPEFEPGFEASGTDAWGYLFSGGTRPQ